MGWISREHYIAHLRSAEWKALRQSALRRAKFSCERCAAKGYLEVHHKHYRTLGAETLDDVEVVCKTCHGKADDQRASEGRHRSSAAALNGWATNAYGENWADRFDSDEVREQFNDWRDRQ